MTSTAFHLRQETVFSLPDAVTKPFGNCWSIFARDFAKVFGAAPKTGDPEAAEVSFILAPAGLAPETFSLTFSTRENRQLLTVSGADELGLIYGMLHLSTEILGVDPFWYWTGQEPEPRAEIAIPRTAYTAPTPRVRYRGWFVNDEVCLLGLSEVYPPDERIWVPVFETLLRLGGNLVIPGTDLPRSGNHWRLAAEMGLYVTQHHAEPLGAEMFHRAHPDSDASYTQNPDMFEALWAEAIERQKDRKVVWTLGFRGQGDQPFWDQDPSYDTPESRGELIGRAIQKQYDMLQAAFDDPPCLTYVYGELTELYRDGHLHFPPGVTRIWSDNGYGRMVSRRQWLDNPRLPSLPAPDDAGPHGIYYHATFHDLQASSHLTMLPVAPALLAGELDTALSARADEVMIVNCGNIRPHLFTLDLIQRVWMSGTVDAASLFDDFAARHFGSAREQAAACMKGYFDAAITYGPNDDDKAGDEFYHHPARALVGHVMRGETGGTAMDLSWAAGEKPFDEQLAWFTDVFEAAVPRYQALTALCRKTADTLTPQETILFDDLLTFQVRFHETGSLGMLRLCQAIAAFRQEDFPTAFVRASQALWAYRETLADMDKAEHSKWKNYFRCDWLTNVRITIYAIDSLRRYFRTFGDNPDYFLWYKEYLMPENEKRVYLENTHRNPPSDDDLAEQLRVKFGL